MLGTLYIIKLYEGEAAPAENRIKSQNLSNSKKDCIFQTLNMWSIFIPTVSFEFKGI